MALAALGLALGSALPLYPVTPAGLLFLWLVVVTAGLYNNATFMSLPVRALVAGTLIGAIVLFRYDLGPHAVFIWGAALVGCLLSDPTKHLSRRAYFLAGALSAVPVILVAAGLFASGILAPAFVDVTQVAGPVYFELRSTPWPGLAMLAQSPVHFAMVYFAPATILAVAVCFLLARRLNGRWMPNPTGAFVIIGSAAALILYTKGFTRPSASHMYIASAMSLFALAALGAGLLTGVGRFLLVPRVVLASATLVGLFLTLHFGQVRAHGTWLNNLDAPATACCADTLGPFRQEGSGGASNERDRAQARLVELTEAGEPILSANGRHDVLILSDVSVYALTGRMPATRWFWYDPGVQTSEPVQREMIADLVRANVRVIYVDAQFDNDAAELYSGREGSSLLDQYIADNYEIDSTFGPISILVRSNDLPLDDGTSN